MKKLFIVSLFAMFLSSFAFAGFSQSELNEYQQVKQTLSTYQDVLTQEYPNSDELISEFINKDHTQGTYEEMLIDLVNLVTTINKQNQSYEIDQDAQAKLDILQTHIINTLALWAFDDLDLDLDVYQKDNLSITQNTSTEDSSNNFSLNLESEQKASSDLSKVEMNLKANFSDESKDDYYGDDSLNVDLELGILKDNSDIYAKIDKLDIDSNHEYDSYELEEINNIKDYLVGNYFHVNLEDTWISASMISEYTLSNVMQSLDNRFLNANTDWTKIFISINPSICNTMINSMYYDCNSFVAEINNYMLSSKEFVYSKKNWVSRIDFENKDLEDSYITWTNDEIRQIKINDWYWNFSYSQWSVKYTDSSTNIYWSVDVWDVDLTIESSNYNDVIDTTKIKISNDKRNIKYNISSESSDDIYWDSTFTIEWNSQYWNISSFDIDTPSDYTEFEEILSMLFL